MSNSTSAAVDLAVRWRELNETMKFLRHQLRAAIDNGDGELAAAVELLAAPVSAELAEVEREVRLVC